MKGCRVAVTLAVVLLLLAACQGGGGAESREPVPTVSTAPVTTSAPITEATIRDWQTRIRAATTCVEMWAIRDEMQAAANRAAYTQQRMLSEALQEWDEAQAKSPCDRP